MRRATPPPTSKAAGEVPLAVLEVGLAAVVGTSVVGTAVVGVAPEEEFDPPPGLELICAPELGREPILAVGAGATAPGLGVPLAPGRLSSTALDTAVPARHGPVPPRTTCQVSPVIRRSVAS